MQIFKYDGFSLRNVIPRRIRDDGRILIIASQVIIVDIVLKAYLPEVKTLVPM